MLLFWDLGLFDILFEGDCLSIVNVVNSPQTLDDVMRPIIYDICCLLETTQGWHVQFALRKSNRVTCSLAKYACNILGECIWMEDCPSSIRNLVLKDKLYNVSNG